jgi:hypothetical protein
MAVEVKIIKNESILLNIPLKNYLVKFVAKEYGKKHKASKTSTLGLHILDLLTKDFIKPVRKRYESFISIAIPYSFCVERGHFVKAADFPLLEKKIDKLFRDVLFIHLKVSYSNNIFEEKAGVYKRIRNFLKYYDIYEDEIKHETLYRDFDRYMKHQKQLNDCF